MKQEYIKRSQVVGLCIQAVAALTVHADDGDMPDADLAAAKATAMTIMELAYKLPHIEVEVEFDDLQAKQDDPGEGKGALQ